MIDPLRTQSSIFVLPLTFYDPRECSHDKAKLSVMFIGPIKLWDAFHEGRLIQLRKGLDEIFLQQKSFKQQEALKLLSYWAFDYECEQTQQRKLKLERKRIKIMKNLYFIRLRGKEKQQPNVFVFHLLQLNYSLQNYASGRKEWKLAFTLRNRRCYKLN